MSRLVVGRYFAFVDQIVEISDRYWGEFDDSDNPLEVGVLIRKVSFMDDDIPVWVWVKTSELARALFPTTEEPADVRSSAA